MKKKDTLIKIAIAAAILIVAAAAALVIVNAKGENQRDEEPPAAAETEAESPDGEATEEAEEEQDKEEKEAADKDMPESSDTGKQPVNAGTDGGSHSQADKKPALNITGHVSYAAPTDCPYTESYCETNGVSVVHSVESGKTVLIKQGKVIGINVVSEEPCFVRLFNDETVFVWESGLGAYLDELEEKGEFYQSYGNTVKVPGNSNLVADMVKSYDAITPMDENLYYRYYD